MKTYPGNVVQVTLALAALVINLCAIQSVNAVNFTSAGPLNTARWGHTVTLLNNGQVLVVGGNGSSGVLSSAELYNPATGTWTATGSLTTARVNHTATLLPSGQVLVAGGNGSSGVLSSAELYNPTTGTWTATGSLTTARFYHTATLLPNGKVLVAAGSPDGFNITSSAELYNPNGGTWTATGSLTTAREGHTATLLPNGLVLVAGGYDFGIISSAELYDPVNEGWTATGGLVTARASHTATLLPNGKVLAAGGEDSAFNTLSSAELYNPSNGRWATTGALATARVNHTATLLPNGNALATGGFDSLGDPLSSAELYDPNNAGGTWTTTGSLNDSRSHHTATLLANGQVLVAGGNGSSGVLSSAELYDPSSPTWSDVGVMNQMRAGQTATLLPIGMVLVAGGFVGVNGWLPNAESYNPATGTWTVTGSLHTARSGHTATLLANGKVLVVGGTNSSGYLPTHYGVEQYNTDVGTWAVPPASCTLCHTVPFPAALDSRPAGHLHVERGQHTATLLGNGKVLVAGGQTGSSFANATELYNPATGFWSLWPVTARSCTTCHTAPPTSGAWDTPAGHLHTPRYGHTATLMPDGTVLVVGGQNANGYLLNNPPNFTSAVNVELNVEQYDPVKGTWAPPMKCEICHPETPPGLSGKGHLNPPGRSFHTATLLPNGKVLVAGGYDGIDVATGVPDDVGMAELYDPVSRTWNPTTGNNMIAKRHGHKATLLTNGKVLVTGGYDSSGPVSSAEVFDPASETWTATSPLATARGDHTATLLPNGNVLAAGGFDSLGDPLSSAEVYNVGLGFSSTWQPQLDPFGSELGLGGNLTLSGSGFRGISEGSCGNSQDSPGDVPVVQLLSLANEQTLFLLPESGTPWSDTSYTSGSVSGFPPGYALATVFVNGIPSAPSDPPLPLDDIPGKGNILDISVPVPTAPTLTNVTILNNGSCQFTFTNSIGALFGVLATKDLALPMTNWTVLGGVTEIALGQFQFIDAQAVLYPQRFYSVYSP